MCAPKISARAQVSWQISFKIVEPNASWWHLPQELVQLLYLFPENMSKRIFQFSIFWWHPFFPETFFQSPQIVARKKCEYFAKRFISNIYGRFLPKDGFQIPPITTFFPSRAVQKQKKWYQIIGQSQIKLFPSFWCFACFGNNTLLIRIWYLIYIYIYIKIWG